jgi:hypothetical protein
MIAEATDGQFGNWTPYKEHKVAASATIPKFSRLGTSVHAAYRGWESFRNQNQQYVEAYLGPGYGNTKDKRRKYINKSQQNAVSIMMSLAANRPTISVESPHKSLWPFAKTLQTAINNLLKEIRFEETLRRWVLDAYFQVGIVKVHRRDSGIVEFEPDIRMDPGCPFASNVSLDDFACDPARNWGEVKWAGDMYRIPYRDIKEGVRTGMFDPIALECCKPSSKYEMLDGNRLEAFGQGEECDTDEFEPMVDLADIWIAAEQRIYTFPVLHRGTFNIKPTPIASMDWLDPDSSPYHLLGFNEAPECIMPVSPASLIDEMDRLINNLMRKQARRAQNQKNVTVFDPSASQTAKRLKDCVDDEILQGNPQQIAPITVGGISPQTQGFMNECLGLVDELGGGINMRLGAAPGSDTATQDEMMRSASSQLMAQMQTRVASATRALVKSLAFELWQDEFKTIAARLPVEGAPEYTYDATWRPGEREGNFLDYEFDVNVYSYNWQNPSTQLNEFITLMTTFYLPLEGQMAAQGGAINLALASNKIAELSNKPWLKDIVSFTNAPPEEGEGPRGDVRGRKPPTNSTYTRRSVSGGGTPQGQRQARSLAWMGAASDQQAGVGGMGNMR